MKYVDGFVLPVSEEKIEHYRDVAQKAGEIWMEHGALAYYECVGDDLDVQDKGCVPFCKGTGIRDGENVVFAWIVYESREHRDQVNAKVMEDSRMKEMMNNPDDMPCDCSRMMYGGFKCIVEID